MVPTSIKVYEPALPPVFPTQPTPYNAWQLSWWEKVISAVIVLLTIGGAGAAVNYLSTTSGKPSEPADLTHLVADSEITTQLTDTYGLTQIELIGVPSGSGRYSANQNSYSAYNAANSGTYRIIAYGGQGSEENVPRTCEVNVGTQSKVTEVTCGGQLLTPTP